jgi:cyclase
MSDFRVIPVLLLNKQGFVKSKMFKNYTYLGDPINILRIFNDKEVDEIAILDIEKNIDKSLINFKRIKDLVSECIIPVSYGGGIRNFTDVKKLFKCGVDKIIFNTNLVSNPDLVKKTCLLAGSQSVIASIDVKINNKTGVKECYIMSGNVNTGLEPFVLVKKSIDLGVGEILINSIDRDGMMCGYDLELIESLAKEFVIPIICLGGSSQIEDFKKAYIVGARAVAASSQFVFIGKRNGILVQYPEKKILKKIINEK